MGSLNSSENTEFSANIDQWIGTLPLLPGVVSQLLALKPDDEKYLDHVNRLASMDPTLTVRIVEYASRNMRVAQAEDGIQLRQAIARLGSRQISNLVLSLSLVDAFPALTQSDRDLWIHSVQVGVISRWLAILIPGLRLDPEHAYLSGLLHDIGRFIVFQTVPEGPSRIDELGWTDPLTLLSAEEKVLGINHVVIGSQAWKVWGIPQTVIDIVERHHDFDLSSTTFEDRQLATRVSVTQMADAISMALMDQLNSSDYFQVEVFEEEQRASVVDACTSAMNKVIERGYTQLSATHQSNILNQIPDALELIIAESHKILTGLCINPVES